jgi:hypothetical protein
LKLHNLVRSSGTFVCRGESPAEQPELQRIVGQLHKEEEEEEENQILDL